MQNFGYTIRTTEEDTVDSIKASVVISEDIKNQVNNPEVLSGEKPYAVEYFQLFLEQRLGTSLPSTDTLYDNIFKNILNFGVQNLLSDAGFVYGAKKARS